MTWDYALVCGFGSSVEAMKEAQMKWLWECMKLHVKVLIGQLAWAVVALALGGVVVGLLAVLGGGAVDRAFGRYGSTARATPTQRATPTHAPTRYRVTRDTNLYSDASADAEDIGVLRKGLQVVPVGGDLTCKTVHVELVELTLCWVRVPDLGLYGWVLQNAIAPQAGY